MMAKVRWVSRTKVKVRWTFAPANDRAKDGSVWCPSGAGLRSDGIVPLNGFARDGEPWTGKRSGTAKRRLGAAERRGTIAADTNCAPTVARVFLVVYIYRSDSHAPADIRPGAICGLVYPAKPEFQSSGMRRYGRHASMRP